MTESEDQDLMRSTFHRFFDKEMPIEKVRALWEQPEGFESDWWKQSIELGWAMLLVPEERGGGSISGNPTADCAILIDEVARAVAPGPFIPASLAAFALATAGGDAFDAVVSELLAGEIIVGWAAQEQGDWTGLAPATTLTGEGDNLILNGVKTCVEAAASLDMVIVTARQGDDLVQVLVQVAQPGITIDPMQCVDLSRRYATLRFSDVPVQARQLIGAPGSARGAAERQLNLAVALQCVELVALADRVFAKTLDYVKTRFTFGRPVGSYQAIKHRMADMLSWLELGKAACARVIATFGEAGAARLSEEASAAKAYVAARMVDLIHDCVQLHGGIGVTWEDDIHVFLRRALVAQSLLGTPEDHRARVMSLLEQRL